MCGGSVNMPTNRLTQPKGRGSIRRRGAFHGESCLAGVVLTLILENGEKAEFSVADEVAIDAARAVEQASEAPARLAFWNWQAARAAAAVRRQQDRLTRLVAMSRRVYRKWIDEETDRSSSEFGLVGEYVDTDRDVVAARKRLSELQEQDELVQSVRDAVEHRAFVLRRLMANESNQVDDR